jgi:hypothetical protein
MLNLLLLKAKNYYLYGDRKMMTINPLEKLGEWLAQERSLGNLFAHGAVLGTEHSWIGCPIQECSVCSSIGRKSQDFIHHLCLGKCEI